jgi:hypothetical protein
MREPEKCHVEYCGYKDPRSPEELEFEILGLETAINEAKKRIGVLKQSAFLVKIAIESNHDSSDSG